MAGNSLPYQTDAVMRIDVHCHVGRRRLAPLEHGRFSFEPAGVYAPYDSYFSDRFYYSIGMRLARRVIRMPLNADEDRVDELTDDWQMEQILGSESIDRAVVLAFDQYHTDAGKPVGPRRRRKQIGTDLYVSNTYIRRLWQRHPQKILFGTSIHPYRTHEGKPATAMLEEVAEAGAVLVKWLPLTQNIDATDPRTVDFLRHAARLDIPVLIHCGMEATLGNLRPEFADPAPLLGTLRKLREEGNMPTVIVAHVATPLLWPFTPGHTYQTLIDALLGEFRDAPLYADIAALAAPSKAHWLKKLANMESIQPKLVYGSDFPVPPTPICFRHRLGSRYHTIKKIVSFIDRDVATKEAVGVDESVFRRGGELLRRRIAHADRLIEDGFDKGQTQR